MVERRDVDLHAFLRLPGRVRVRRWRSGMVSGYSERHVSVGHLPDGAWWVEDTGDRQHVAVFTAGTSVEARRAAQAHADGLMAGGGWQPVIATYEPGVAPARPTEVPEWPAGNEPPDAD